MRLVFSAEIVMRAASQLWCAVYDNSVYSFKTWRWGKVLGPYCS